MYGHPCLTEGQCENNLLTTFFFAPMPPMSHSFVNSVTDKLTGAVSLSAAVFSSVLTASCMPSEMDVVRTQGLFTRYS